MVPKCLTCKQLCRENPGERWGTKKKITNKKRVILWIGEGFYRFLDINTFKCGEPKSWWWTAYMHETLQKKKKNQKRIKNPYIGVYYVLSDRLVLYLCSRRNIFICIKQHIRLHCMYTSQKRYIMQHWFSFRSCNTVIHCKAPPLWISELMLVKDEDSVR